MPSLFTRSRTHSSPNRKLSLPTDDTRLTSDEFGRVTSRSSTRGISSTPGKKDKKRDKDDRLWTRSSKDRVEHPVEVPEIEDGAFLPLCLERPADETGVEYPAGHPYGYLSYERHVVLGLGQVSRLVRIVVSELEARGGFNTPFIFSSLALDVSAPAIKRLIHTFLATCDAHPPADAERRWRDEARFAGMHELGVCLRWGLARVVRRVGGQDVRGLVSWDHYIQFKDSEAASKYPVNHFSTFLSGLTPPLPEIIVTILSFLSRLTAHSASSGHTPPTLSPLFGPLFLGLGPPTLAFHHAYVHYLWAANAAEHLILAFIRWQDAPATDPITRTSHGSATALGVPARLKEWIRGYPTMLPFLKEDARNHKPQARRGARTVRVLSVRRNVRIYSPDLVRTAASWGQRPRPGTPSHDRGLSQSREWDRILPSTLKLAPRYSEAFKKRMDMPSNYHPDSGAAGYGLNSPTSSMSSGTSASLLEEKDPFGLGAGRLGEDRFRSLTDLKWGEFETMGFGGLEPDEKKLQFDLTEGARNARTAKRATLSWNDFSSAGFTRTDAPLSATLQFSTPVATTISSWPSQHAELQKKLKKTQRALPQFGWDTEPIVGSEEMIEEAFVDVFCDLIYGGGWMDLERLEDTDRECNWALIEFKALPSQRSTSSGASDPRTATSMLLFEEFVPFEYRQQLAEGNTGRRRLPTLFGTSNKSKQWKPALTLNGRPYVVGSVPRSPSYREVEFEGLLHGTGGTKVISLGSKTQSRIPSMAISTISEAVEKARPIKKLQKEESQPDSAVTPTKKTSRFRLADKIPLPSPNARKAGRLPAEYSTVDFETRLASYSDDEYEREGADGDAERQARRESKDDAWMEILVGPHNRRIGEQEAEFRKPGEKNGGRPVLPDPEFVSMEVAQALAGLERRPFSDDEGDAEVLPDVVVDEVQLVPRRMAMYDMAGDLSIRQDDSQDEEEEDEPTVSQGTGPSAESDGGYEDEEHDDQLTPTSSGLSHHQQQKAQRRLGYFDLHPERRPSSVQDDDPRMRLEQPSDEEDEADDDDIYGPPDDSGYAAPLAPAKPGKYVERDQPSSVIDAAEYGHAEARLSEWDDSHLELGGVGPKVDYKGKGVENGNVNPSSKTAALIEMYRKKERGGTTSSVPNPVTPSRLPVRALPATPKDVPTQELSSSPALPTEPLMDAPRVQLKDTGRSSPARYVHGAPLLRVLEEEELSH